MTKKKAQTIILLLITLLFMSGCNNDNTNNKEKIKQEIKQEYSIDNNTADYPIDTEIIISFEGYNIISNEINQHIKLLDSNNKEVKITILKNINVNSTDTITIKYDTLKSNSKYKLIVDNLYIFNDNNDEIIKRTILFTTENKIIKPTITDLQNTINDKNSDIITLTTDKKDLQNQIIALNTDKTNLQNNINDLDNQIITLKTEKTNLENLLTADKTDLQNQIDTLTTEKTNLQNNINDLDNQINTLTTTNTDLQSQIDTLTTDKINLQYQIDTLTALPTYNDMTNLLFIETSVITTNLQQNIVLVFKDTVNSYSFYSDMRITDSSNTDLNYTVKVENNVVSIKLDNAYKTNETYTIFIDKLVMYDGTKEAYKIIFNTTIDANHLNTYFTKS